MRSDTGRRRTLRGRLARAAELQVKSAKDLSQAAALFTVLAEDRPGDILLAYDHRDAEGEEFGGEAAAEYTGEFKSRYIRANKIDVSFVEAKIKERSSARVAGDYTKADAIREELARLNISIQDKPGGTDWAIAF